MKIDGNEITDKTEIANVVNNFFSDIGKNLADKINSVSDKNFEYYLNKMPRCENRLKLRRVHPNEVSKIINSLKPKTSSGSDNLSSRVLKHLGNDITESLTILINRSVTENYIPPSWKTAKVIPLYKSGDEQEVGNRRPISLLPAFSKVLEKVVRFQLKGHFIRNNLYYEKQYGFRSGRETSDLLIDVLNTITKTKKKITGSFIDLKKVFDCMNHVILLSKLEYYNVDSEWFKSYLQGRTQYVQLDNIKSDTRNITVGVPQGSVLGPELFLIFFKRHSKSNLRRFRT